VFGLLRLASVLGRLRSLVMVLLPAFGLLRALFMSLVDGLFALLVGMLPGRLFTEFGGKLR